MARGCEIIELGQGTVLRIAMIELNYSRIDGALLRALEETPLTERLLSVFVQTQQPPVGEQLRRLEDLGIAISTRPTRIFTATLSPDEVGALSQEDWIKSIKLSQRLKKLPDAQST